LDFAAQWMLWKKTPKVLSQMVVNDGDLAMVQRNKSPSKNPSQIGF